MTEQPPLPRLVEQTKALLWLHMYVLLIAFVIVTVYVGTVAVDVMSNDESADAVRFIFAMLGSAALLALASRLFRRRSPVVWVIALVAEGCVAALIFVGLSTGAFFGITAMVFTALTLWVAVNLFRPEVLRHFFTRH